MRLNLVSVRLLNYCGRFFFGQESEITVSYVWMCGCPVYNPKLLKSFGRSKNVSVSAVRKEDFTNRERQQNLTESAMCMRCR